MRPAVLLRAEGLALFAAAVVAYYLHGGGWFLFVVAFLGPDLSMLGYLATRRVGALAYNAAHAGLLPVLLLGVPGTLAGRSASASP